jgi:hypothetical protein
MSRKSGMRMQTRYLATADGNLHQGWLQRVKVDTMRQNHNNGDLVAPGRPQPTPTLSKLAIKVDSDGSSSKPQSSPIR